MREDGKIKESVFTIGYYVSAPNGETPEGGEARRALVKLGINPAQYRQLERIKRAQENATTFEVMAK